MGEIPVNQILQGNCAEILHNVLEPKIAHCCITSPPYYKMRFYKTPPAIWDDDPSCQHEWEEKKVKQHAGRGDSQRSGKYSEQESIPDMVVVYAMCKKCHAYKGELGQEPTPDLYIKHLMWVIDGIHRVLRDDGSFYLNIGDKYDKKNSLMGIPFKVALLMTQQGWIWRNTIIWHKRNAIPQSDKTKFTPDFEYIFFMTKKGSGYYHDTQHRPYSEYTMEQLKKAYTGKNKKNYEEHGAQPASDVKRRILKSAGANTDANQRTTYQHNNPHRMRIDGTNDELAQKAFTFPPVGGVKKAGGDNPTYSGNRPPIKAQKMAGDYGQPIHGMHEARLDGEGDYVALQGSLMRCVWDVTTVGFKDLHYAVFPEKLVTIPIKASCPEYICNKCGSMSKSTFAEYRLDTRPGDNVLTTDKSGSTDDPNQGLHRSELSTKRQEIIREPTGMTSCGCNAGTHSGIVLDPFMGAGTVALTALKLGRRFIGIELLPENVAMAVKRIRPYMQDSRLF